MNEIGIVIIGRNEGQRLVDCIESIPSSIRQVVYVDSNSQDNSVHNAESRGCLVHSLDLSIPFTAGRARNEGFDLLIEAFPDVKYVQFVDGDCSIDQEWLFKAQQHLLDHEQIAVACGRRKEKFPEKTIYNQLCDIEWDSPIGIARNCGGDFMIKRHVFKEVSGFNPTVIAGEEPELCFRIRAIGNLVERLDLPMTYHDADMTRFGQWWQRAVRCGHTWAEGYTRYGRTEEKFNKKQLFSALIWSSFLPLSLVLAPVSLYFLFILVLYPLQVFRLWLRNRRLVAGFWYSFFLVLSKFPETVGIFKYFSRRLLNHEFRIIEYK